MRWNQFIYKINQLKINNWIYSSRCFLPVDFDYCIHLKQPILSSPSISIACWRFRKIHIIIWRWCLICYWNKLRHRRSYNGYNDYYEFRKFSSNLGQWRKALFILWTNNACLRMPHTNWMRSNNESICINILRHV